MESYQKYLNSVLKFLSYRSRSEKEVYNFLQKKKTPQEFIEKILVFLREKRFVNDEEFARWWIDQRLRSKPRSIKFLTFELKNKGISEKMASRAISNFTSLIPDEGEKGINDLETAKQLVAKKIMKYKHLPKQELYQKLGGFLGRRGFDWETSKRAIEQVISMNVVD